MTRETLTLLIALGAVILPAAVIIAAAVYDWMPRRRSRVRQAATRAEAEAIARERAARMDRERQALLAFAAHDREDLDRRAREAAAKTALGVQGQAIGREMRRNLAALEATS